MAERLNQHYVPQFYFRHFSVNGNTTGMLLVRDGRVFTRAPIKGQCSRKNFYGSKELEAQFAQFESHHCTAIRAALEVTNIASAEFFSMEELRSFYDAIVFQRARTATEVAKHGPAIEKMLLFMFRKHLETTENEGFLEKFDENVAAGKISITESEVDPNCCVLPQSELEFSFAGVSMTTGAGETHEVPSQRLVAA